MSKKLRIGVIGLGVGEAHVRGYQSHPSCEVVALCDHDPAKQREMSQKYPQYAFHSTAAALLTDPAIDAVSIATYDDVHYEHLMMALKNNKHAFVEKPLCQTEAQAKEIATTLKALPHLKISSNLILREYPRFKRLRSMISNGELGSLYLLEGDYNFGRLEKITQGWRGSIKDYSVVLGGGIHLVDLFTWLISDTVVEVFAYGNQIASKNTRFQYNDMVIALLSFQSGLVGKIAVNFGCVYPHFHKMSVYGTKATFTHDLDGANTYLSRDANAVPIKMSEPYPGVGKDGLIHDFIDAILLDKEPSVSRKNIFDVLAICLAIQQSVLKRQPVKVKELQS